MYVTSNIGAVLRKTREFQLYSVTEAAEFAGIAPAQLIDIEVGGRNVKKSVLAKLCDLYHLAGWRKDLFTTAKAMLPNGNKITLRRGKVYVNGKRVINLITGEEDFD